MKKRFGSKEEFYIFDIVYGLIGLFRGVNICYWNICLFIFVKRKVDVDGRFFFCEFWVVVFLVYWGFDFGLGCERIWFKRLRYFLGFLLGEV